MNNFKVLSEVLKNEPAFRIRQIEKSWFDTKINSYDQITTLPVPIREKLKTLPWYSLIVASTMKSNIDNTQKILFQLQDRELIETVIMGRKNLKVGGIDANDRYTICISSQVGCPMRCVFCETGRLGFKRQLQYEEIVDQYRFCQKILSEKGQRISNIVVMGQGEPLLNYDNIKKALNTIIAHADIGETKITLSTAGVPAIMEQLLKDKEFPKVRLAISLHSAIEETRKKIMPSHKTGFLEFLVKWADEYHEVVPSRTHFIGFEYIMLKGVNDDEKHLVALVRYCKKFKHLRINLIPYNSGSGGILVRTEDENIKHWHEVLMKAGFVSTIRHSQGQDIAAACGQLRSLYDIKKEPSHSA